MFGRLGWAEILIIVVLVLILFSHNKIPSMMKNLADGLKVFKTEMKSDKKDSEKSAPVKSTKSKNAPAKSKSAKVAKSSGNYVEFGTYASVAAAQKAQRKLTSENGDLFADVEFVVLDQVASGKHKFQLQAGFSSATAAKAFHARAKKAGVKCTLI